MAVVRSANHRGRAPLWTAHGVCLLFVLAAGALLSQAVAQDESPTARRTRIEALSAQEKEELEQKKSRFDKLEDPDREALRRIHENISQRPDSAELLDTLERYTEWLSTLSSADRSQLLDMRDPDERVARMRELMKEQEKTRFKQFVGDLQPKDSEAIYEWVEAFVRRHEQAIIQVTPREFRERLLPENTPDEEKRLRHLVGTWHFRYLRNWKETPRPSETDFEELIKRLSPEGQKLVDPAHPEAKERVDRLMQAAIFVRYNPPPSVDELGRFYSELPPAERERLDSLEPGQVKVELRRMYFWAKMQGGRGGSGFRGQPPPGVGPPEESGKRGDGRRDDERTRGDRGRDDRDGNEGRDRSGPSERRRGDENRDEREDRPPPD